MGAKDYDSFAKFYDLAMGDHSQVAHQIHLLIQKHHRAARSLLELGCGSGNLLKVLSQHYQCSGIDLSRQMIEQARRKLPDLFLSVSDMTTVRVAGKFDVVLCAFDTINHLSQFSQWRKVFARAYAHLNPGGIFIFDINTPDKINRYHQEQAYAEVQDGLISIFEVERRTISRYAVTVRVLKQVKGKEYGLHELVVHGATFPLDKIMSSLQKKFSHVSAIDLERKRISSRSDEVYFICKKAWR